MSKDQKYSTYQIYVLTLLFGVGALHYLDRNIIAILIVPISNELQLDDTEIGLLSGLAFGVVYALSSIPIAHLADRTSRVRILTISVAVWSAMTAACGFAKSFSVLFLMRMGVGAGEAGGQPTMQAIIADLFTEAQRARVLSVLAVGGNVGVFLGLALGGIVTEKYGWRAAFWLAGGAGLIVSLVMGLTLRTRPAPGQVGFPKDKDTAPTLSHAVRTMLAKPSYIYLLLGGSFATIGLYAVQIWSPTFLIRSYDLTISNAGLSYGVFYCIAAGLGTLIGGYLGDYYFRIDRRGHALVVMISFIGAVPFLLLAYLSTNLIVTLVGIAAAGMISHFYAGPLFASIQGLAGPNLRAVAAAVFMMTITLTGASAGPLLVGVASDMLQPAFGQEALRYALCLATLSNVLASAFFLLAAKYIRQDLDAEGADTCVPARATV